jgi:predicted HicB family RNase H-like nuclease
MVKLTIRLEEADHFKATYKAKKGGVSFAQYIRNLIENDK